MDAHERRLLALDSIQVTRDWINENVKQLDAPSQLWADVRTRDATGPLGGPPARRGARRRCAPQHARAVKTKSAAS